MGRPSRALSTAIANGNVEKHPERYISRVEIEQDEVMIGACPLYFDPLQRECWHELTRRLWWLRAPDYAMCEGAALLYARMRLTGNEETIIKLANILSKLGATPTSRGSIMFPKDATKKSRFA